MQELSLFVAPESTSERQCVSLLSVLSEDNIARLAMNCGVLKRDRKFKPAVYVMCILRMMCKALKSSEFTLNSMHYCYNMNQSREERISHKCIHNQLRKDESLEMFKALCSECLCVFNTSSLQKRIKKILPDDLSALLSQLAVDDILLVDGTEIDLDYSCASNFKCRAKGRNNLDGHSARPGLKLHVIFSLKSMSFLQLEITEAVGDERECVHPENFHNVLFIADRGYVNEALEDKIAASGNLFLIRGKSNTTGTIVRAFNDGAQRICGYSGIRFSAVDKKQSIDTDIVSFKGHKLRVISRYNEKSRTDSKRNIIRTNIPRDRLGAKQIMLLYRVRWLIELFNKANKRSSCLMSINSANRNIILEFILMSFTVSLFKTYCSINASCEYDIKWCSMLKLHKLNGAFERMFKTMLTRKLSCVYLVFKELLKEIAEACRRSKPSLRDRILLKDLPFLMNQIVNQPKASIKIS